MHCSCCKEILREIFPNIFIMLNADPPLPTVGVQSLSNEHQMSAWFFVNNIRFFSSSFFLLLLLWFFGFFVLFFMGFFGLKYQFDWFFFKRNYFYEKQIILTIIQSQQKDQCDENLLPVSEQFFELLLLANLKPIYVNNRNQSYVALIKLCHFSSLSFIKIMADFLYLVYIVQKGAADIYYGV